MPFAAYFKAQLVAQYTSLLTYFQISKIENGAFWAKPIYNMD